MKYIYISTWIVREVSEKLTNKLRIQLDESERVQNFLHSGFNIIKPSGGRPIICRDEDDNNVLHIADYIKVDLLITGDKDLLDLKEYFGIKILTPREFIENYY